MDTRHETKIPTSTVRSVPSNLVINTLLKMYKIQYKSPKKRD